MTHLSFKGHINYKSVFEWEPMKAARLVTFGTVTLEEIKFV